MSELTFRAVLDDGTIINWYDDLTMPDGSIKPASIDDIDRSKLSNLLTVDQNGKVVHALGFPPEDRATKRAVWRLNRKINPNLNEGQPTTVGALAGYNQLFPDGHTELKLDFIDAETGETSSAVGYECQLHPLEVFTPEAAKEIRDAQAKQNAETEADNALIAASEAQDKAEMLAAAEPGTDISPITPPDGDSIQTN